MLYWDANLKREIRKVCKPSCWKDNISSQSMVFGSENKKNKVPTKILRYFPLKPRLQCLFMSSKAATHMRWHTTANIMIVNFDIQEMERLGRHLIKNLPNSQLIQEMSDLV